MYDTCNLQQTRPSIVQILPYYLFRTKPLLPEPMQAYCESEYRKQISVKFLSKHNIFHSRTSIWECHVRNGGHLVLASMCLKLTHWGQVMHICGGKLTIISSDNGLLTGQCHAIIWTNAGILLIGPLGTNFSEISIGIQTFLFKYMHLKMLSAKWRPFCLGFNVSAFY